MVCMVSPSNSHFRFDSSRLLPYMIKATNGLIACSSISPRSYHDFPTSSCQFLLVPCHLYPDFQVDHHLLEATFCFSFSYVHQRYHLSSTATTSDTF